MSDEQQTPEQPATPEAPAPPETPEAPETAAPPEPTFDPSQLSSGPTEALEPRPRAEPEAPDAHGWWWGTGRRKKAVARTRMRPGTGNIQVQVSRKTFKTVEDYFSEEQDRRDVYAPLEATNLRNKFDVVCRPSGGGHMGQAQAIRLGIARALRKYDPSLEDVLREHGHLTRDARQVERKKYGLAGARRSFQFSKR